MRTTVVTSSQRNQRLNFFTRLVLALMLASVAHAATVTPGATDPGNVPAVPACGAERLAAATLPSALPVRRADAAWPPAISAKAAVVIDAETGRVLYDLEAHKRRPPASTTKIMTAILALETVPQDDWAYSVTDSSLMVHSSVMGLRPGVYITIRDLLYGLMLPSGNDAAIELARHVDGDVRTFVERMNAKLGELGLRDTNFRNPHGLDQRNHYSTAYDLSMIGRYAMANEEFRNIASARSYHLQPPSDYDLVNGNSLLDLYPGADGIKIGWTDRAGWTLVASAVRDGRRIYVTVLDSEDRDADAIALFDWAFASYEWRPVGERALRQLRIAQKLGLAAPLIQTLGVCG